MILLFRSIKELIRRFQFKLCFRSQEKSFLGGDAGGEGRKIPGEVKNELSRRPLGALALGTSELELLGGGPLQRI